MLDSDYIEGYSANTVHQCADIHNGPHVIKVIFASYSCLCFAMLPSSDCLHRKLLYGELSRILVHREPSSANP